MNDYKTRILDNLNTVTLLFDSDLKLRYLNPAGEVLFQVSARHVMGQHATTLIHCPGGVVKTNLKRALHSGRPFTEREMSLPLSEDRSVTVDCTVIPLSPREGESGLLVELQQIDRQLRISREEQPLLLPLRTSRASRSASVLRRRPRRGTPSFRARSASTPSPRSRSTLRRRCSIRG